MSSPIIDRLDEVVAEVGAKTAIIQDKKAISFQHLKESVHVYSSQLAQREIVKGDRVLIFVPMSIRLYIILLAVWRRGAVAVFVDAWTSKNRLDQVARQTDCKAFIGVPKAHLLRFFSAELRSIPQKHWELPFPKKTSRCPETATIPVGLDATALVTFTTGSTGIPKGADRTHGFLLAQNQALSEHLNLSKEDIDLSTLPVFVLNNLANGITSILAPFNPAKPEALNPEKVADVVRRHQISTAAGSPVVFDKLADHCIKVGKTLSTLKKVFIGGAPVFPHLAEKLLNALPKTDIEIIYGSTEAEPISAISAANLVSTHRNVFEQGLAVGQPVRQIKLAILKIGADISHEMDKAKFEAIGLPEKEVGEICVSGDHVLKRYFNNPEAQAENKIVAGSTIWHRTGDAGYLNAAGHLFLMGRVSQRIQIAGQTLFPFPYEEAISRIENITTGTLLLIRNAIVVAVELTGDRKATRVMVTQALADINLPFSYSVHFGAIPRDPRHNSKIDYSALANKISDSV